MRRFLILVPVATLALGATACASKGFVRRSVADVDRKADSLGRSLETTQERTRKNEVRIGEVDQKVQVVDRKAVAATVLAKDASNTVLVASAKMDAMDKASKRLDYDLVLTQAEGGFRFGDSELPASAKAKIDEVIHQLAQDPKNVHIEIEGHTDSVGDPTVNREVGRRRALAVQRYLYEQYNIPLHKMNIISYGQQKPVATNGTRSGRALNRRIVLRIVA